MQVVKGLTIRRSNFTDGLNFRRTELTSVFDTYIDSSVLQRGYVSFFNCVFNQSIGIRNEEWLTNLYPLDVTFLGCRFKCPITEDEDRAGGIAVFNLANDINYFNALVIKDSYFDYTATHNWEGCIIGGTVQSNPVFKHVDITGNTFVVDVPRMTQGRGVILNNFAVTEYATVKGNVIKINIPYVFVAGASVFNLISSGIMNIDDNSIIIADKAPDNLFILNNTSGITAKFNLFRNMVNYKTADHVPLYKATVFLNAPAE